MSPRLPDGEPAPVDGALPAHALAGFGTRPFGLYVHVPFCASRCGYCDFNTYVPGEGVRRDGFVDGVLAEWALARRVLGGDPPPAATVFVGGGTPTLLPVGELARLLDALPRARGAEVTVEANPDSVDRSYLRALRAAGATRLSLGMQSAAGHVLAALGRSHTPGAAVAAARAAREAGFAHVSLDLIHGAPGEAARCAHNGGYWRSHDWWGLGPGAHSHVGGVRWWNVLHPERYAERTRSGASPAAGREVLSPQQRALERTLLGI